MDHSKLSKREMSHGEHNKRNKKLKVHFGQDIVAANEQATKQTKGIGPGVRKMQRKEYSSDDEEEGYVIVPNTRMKFQDAQVPICVLKYIGQSGLAIAKLRDQSGGVEYVIARLDSLGEPQFARKGAWNRLIAWEGLCEQEPVFLGYFSVGKKKRIKRRIKKALMTFQAEEAIPEIEAAASEQTQIITVGPSLFDDLSSGVESVSAAESDSDDSSSDE